MLIGRPNVGKSNILEAMSLFDIPYLVNNSQKSLRTLVRTENIADLFHNGVTAHPIEVNTNISKLSLSRNVGNGLSTTIEYEGQQNRYSFSSSLNILTKKEAEMQPPIRTYFFPKQIVSESANGFELLPPSGENLMSVVANLPQLKESLSELFHNYGLKMVFDSASQQIRAMKETGSDIFLVPFSSFADSLQRLIFYKAAILSNHFKALCFEEPESHTFPPYISSIVSDILASTDNQFFLTTHSPYIVNTLLEDGGDQLAIYIVDMVDGATTARQLNDAELQHAYDNGIDFFFNLETYLSR